MLWCCDMCTSSWNACWGVQGLRAAIRPVACPMTVRDTRALRSPATSASRAVILADDTAFSFRVVMVTAACRCDDGALELSCEGRAHPEQAVTSACGWVLNRE